MGGDRHGGVNHRPVELQHPEQHQAELVVLPAVDDDVSAGVENQEGVGEAGQQLGPGKNYQF